MSAPSLKPLSRRARWLLFFWGGTAVVGAGLALAFVMFAAGDGDPEGPLGLLALGCLVAGLTSRRIAKRTVRSLERGGDVEVDRFGPAAMSFLERRRPRAQRLSLGAAEPEPGLRRHVVIGDGGLIAGAAVVIAVLVVAFPG